MKEQYKYLKICNLRTLLSDESYSSDFENISFLDEALNGINVLIENLYKFEELLDDDVSIKNLGLISDTIKNVEFAKYFIEFYKNSNSSIPTFVNYFLCNIEKNEGIEMRKSVNKSIASYLQSPDAGNICGITKDLHYLKIWHEKICNTLINEHGEELDPEIIKELSKKELLEEEYPLENIIRYVVSEHKLMEQFIFLLKKDQRNPYKSIINRLAVIDKSVLDEYNKRKSSFNDKKLHAILLNLDDSVLERFVEVSLKERKDIRKSLRASIEELITKIIISNSHSFNFQKGDSNKYKNKRL